MFYEALSLPLLQQWQRRLARDQRPGQWVFTVGSNQTTTLLQQSFGHAKDYQVIVDSGCAEGFAAEFIPQGYGSSF